MLCQAEGERLELPRPFRATPVFETGALPVRLTLRSWSRIHWMMNYSYSSQTPFMPQAGFEPAPARFLRPPPLPLGYCGFSALSRIRTCNTGILSPRPLPAWATRAFSGPRRDSNPHLLGANQASCHWTTGPCFSALREGFEPSSSAFGGPRSSDRAVATCGTMKSER